MYANSVFPPFDGMARACRSEYFAGITLNELSECHRRLPMAKSRRRASRAEVFLFWSGVGAAQARVRGLLELAQALGEGELLVVGDVLIMENQHRVLVHAGVNRRHLVCSQGLGHVDAFDLGGEAQTDLAGDDGHVENLPLAFDRF